MIVSQVGFFTVPVGLVLVAVLGWRWPGEALGLAEGAAAVAVLIGAINLDYRPCPPGGVTILRPGRTDAGCGGFDGTPWLVGGLVGMIGVAVLFWLLKRASG